MLTLPYAPLAAYRPLDTELPDTPRYRLPTDPSWAGEFESAHLDAAGNRMLWCRECDAYHAWDPPVALR